MQRRKQLAEGVHVGSRDRGVESQTLALLIDSVALDVLGKTLSEVIQPFLYDRVGFSLAPLLRCFLHALEVVAGMSPPRAGAEMCPQIPPDIVSSSVSTNKLPRDRAQAVRVERTGERCGNCP